MNAQEFATISMAIKAAYPSANLMPDRQSKDVWFTMLGDIDYKVCMTALKEIIANNKFTPTIAEIREKCSSLTSPKIKDWGEAWESVIRAIGKFGMYNTQDALDSFDETTRICVKRIGFQNICRDEDYTASRANFRMIYEIEAKRKKANNQLPPQLRAEKQIMIDKLVENTAKMIGG
jgi:hypothetical protein